MSEESALGKPWIPLFQRKSFALFFTSCIGFAIYWYSTSDLFQVPKDVFYSRKQFFAAKESYSANRNYWDAKMWHCAESIRNEMHERKGHNILQRLQEIPNEVLVSFLASYLNVTHLDTFVLFPKEENSACIILSKVVNSTWPFTITLSLEVEVRFNQETFSLHFLRLRKGKRDIGLGLAWAYFGAELERLRTLAHIQ